jgi:chromosome segregation protein
MDIFLGTGFGPRSYSIIEQGMISQLVEAKPEDLRVYLEEAAGISKYKERRRETENRIRHTEENLDRLKDIREELARQLDHLQRQAKSAERYRGLKAEERTTTAQLHALRLVALEAVLAEREPKSGRSKCARTRVAQQRSVDADIEKSRVRHTEQSDEFNRVQGRFYQLGADIARIEEAVAYNQQRVNNSNSIWMRSRNAAKKRRTSLWTTIRSATCVRRWRRRVRASKRPASPIKRPTKRSKVPKRA